MKQRRRIYYTETDKALMWDRWEEGDIGFNTSDRQRRISNDVPCGMLVVKNQYIGPRRCRPVSACREFLRRGRDAP